MMGTISEYVHRCVVQEGDMAGNTYRVDVSAGDFEYGNECDNCGAPLVTADELLAHIYRELTE